MNTTEWEPTYWSGELLGTRVKLTKGLNEIVGVLRSLESGDHQILVDGGGIVSLGRPGAWGISTEKVPAVVLPTEPGWYFDKDGDPWEIEKWTDESLNSLYAPYTRIPTRAEVAAEVLEEVRAMYFTDDPNYWGRLDKICDKWATK